MAASALILDLFNGQWLEKGTDGAGWWSNNTKSQACCAAEGVQGYALR